MSDAPTPRRLRRTIGLVIAVAVVAILTPIITIVVSTPEFMLDAARFVSPWSMGSSELPANMPATTVATTTTDPEVAAEALRRVIDDNSPGDNITMRTSERLALPPRDSVPAGIFPEARDTAGGALDGPKTLRAARRRLTPAERAYLADVAQNPFWQQWDLLARAQSLDVLKARVELPFGEHATPMELPLMRLTKLADAGRFTGIRAAHFIAAGRRDSAEAAVHATLAVGLLLDREATNVLEAFMGRRLVYQATTLSNSLRGDSTIVELTRMARDSSVKTETEARALLVSIASDSTAHRAARFEALINLGMAPCTNLGELLFGFGSDIEGAFAAARRNLVRQPSDSALLALIESSSERSPDLHESGIFPAMFRGMSHFSSMVLFNKRIHGCAEMLPYFRVM